VIYNTKINLDNKITPINKNKEVLVDIGRKIIILTMF